MDQLVTLAIAHKWLALAAVLIGLAVRLLKDDTKLPTIPKKWRPWLAVGLGVVSGIIEKAAAGGLWRDALLAGFLTGVLPILADLLGVNLVAKDIPLPAAMLKDPTPATPGRPGVGIKIVGGCFLGLFVLLAGCISAAKEAAIAKATGDETACIVLHYGEPIPAILADCAVQDAEMAKAILDAMEMSMKKKLGAACASSASSK